MGMSTRLYRKLMDLEPTLREVVFLLLEEVERQNEKLAQQVTRVEFVELTKIVAGLSRSVTELAEAQKRSEERLTRLEVTVAELAEAQKRSEERLTRLEVTVAELAEAQKRTEERLNELAEAQKRSEERLTRLEVTVAELAEAQKRTEERLNELAEAQKRTEERLNELAEAQKRTEDALTRLALRHDELHERLEGLSNTVGYTLEDRALFGLPRVLEREGVTLEGALVRKYAWVGRKGRQINIYGHGRRGDRAVLIVGEAKVRPSRKEIQRFVRLAQRLAEAEGREPFLLFVAYDFPPEIEEYLRQRAILPVWSYELPLA